MWAPCCFYDAIDIVLVGCVHHVPDKMEEEEAAVRASSLTFSPIVIGARGTDGQERRKRVVGLMYAKEDVWRGSWASGVPDGWGSASVGLAERAASLSKSRTNHISGVTYSPFGFDTTKPPGE